MDDRTFRNALGKFATGVTIITASWNGEIRGMTANAFMSVSLHPKLVVVSINEKAKMNDFVKNGGKYAVNILTEEQKTLSQIFAGQLKEEIDVEFQWVNDHPILPQSLAYILCEVENAYVTGDHILYIGKVTNLSINEGSPLLFYEGKYRAISQNDH